MTKNDRNKFQHDQKITSKFEHLTKLFKQKKNEPGLQTTFCQDKFQHKYNPITGNT